MKISSRNHFAALGDADMIVPAADVGYEGPSLVRGPLARPWQSLSPTSLYEVGVNPYHRLAFRTQPVPRSFYAVLGASVLDPEFSTIAEIRVYRSFTLPVSSPVLVGTMVQRAPGDWFLDLAVPQTSSVVELRIYTTGSTKIRIGKAWAGTTSSPSAPSAVRRTRSGNVLRNESEARTFSAARLASRTVDYDLSWPALLSTQEQAIADELEACGWGESPVLLQPDEKESAAYRYGYLSTEIGTEWDASRLQSGLRLSFSEEGRAIG